MSRVPNEQFEIKQIIAFALVGYVYIIDQARGQDGSILAQFSFCVFMDREEGQYPAILTELAWSIKDLLYGIKALKKMIGVIVYFRALKRKPVRC